MSWAKITDLDNHFLKESGDGIEEIVLSEAAFDSLLKDVAVRRNLDYIDLETQDGKSATNIKFHTQSRSIVITKSVKLEIERTEYEIQGLQQKLTRLKTRNI